MYLVVFMVSVMVCTPVHMYLVVFMVSVMALYHLYICI